MRALITGDAGFVGRHMRETLERAGYDVLGVDIDNRPGSPKAWSIDCRRFFHTPTQPKFDLVVHCAAVVGGRMTIDGKPLWLATEDLSIDAEMFAWAARTRPRKLVYFSSSAAYPIKMQQRGQRVSLREDDIDLQDVRQPDAMYGWVKLTGEQLAVKAQAAGVDVLVVRPFSGYGSDQSTDYPFQALLQRVLGRKDPFEVWGDGTQVRDFIHIDDVCNAVLAAVEKGETGPVNLATDRGTSFADLAALMFRSVGWYPDEVRYRADKPVGVHYRRGSTECMRQFYLPTVSLEDGVQRAVEALS